MKRSIKKLLIPLALALCLALAACGSPAESGDPAGTPAEGGSPAEQFSPEALAEQGFTEVDEDAPFGVYRSPEELSAIILGGAEDENASMPSSEIPELVPPAPDSGEVDVSDYAGVGNTTVFTDDEWEEPSVEFVDLQEAIAAEGGGEAGGADGGGQASGEYLAGLPETPGSVAQSMEEDGTYTVMTTLPDAGSYDSYLAAVKEAGFNVDADEADMSPYGVNMKTYTASHADGRVIMLTLSELSLIIEITK